MIFCAVPFIIIINFCPLNGVPDKPEDILVISVARAVIENISVVLTLIAGVAEVTL